jgi:hypothetical protein
LAVEGKLPLPNGAQQGIFASDGYDGYATWAAGPDTINLLPRLVNIVLFTPAPLLEAGEGRGDLRPLFVPTAAQGWTLSACSTGRNGLPLLDRGYQPKLAFVAGGLFVY